MEQSELRYNIHQRLIVIADNELERINKKIPDDPSFCFALLLEATRMYDYLHFGPVEDLKKYSFSFQQVDVIKSGWNLAASLLLKSQKDFHGIPVMQSAEESKTSIISLLYQLGCVTLLWRTAEMVKSGILIAEFSNDNSYTFSMSVDGKAQFLDEMELSYLEDLENKLEQDDRDFYKGWELVDYDNIDMVFQNYGSFLSKKPRNEFASVQLKDMESKMLPLIKPWESGKGIMMGYDSTEELDWHFMASAARAMSEWKDNAGLHPDLKIDEIKMSDIMAVAMCLVSFNLKHIKFSSIAAEKRKEILIFPSLTIWCSLSELINDISAFTKIEKQVVEEVFRIISLRSDDAILLKMHTTKFMPLIIDLENNYVLRPVSGILRNPLNTLKDLLTLRNPELLTEFNKRREEWLRSHLYAMFAGNRYYTVDRNIELKIDGKSITDIDAVIYDNVTGELALFQIKWQDYHFNDVKKLRSRASNLIRELEEWTHKVCDWISTQGVKELSKKLGLSDDDRLLQSEIYLFGLSKNAARMKGYGFDLKEKRIAVATWAQFKRNRTEIGPSKSVFGDLFTALKQQENSEVKTTPAPVTFKVSDKEFYYKDLWNIVE